MAKLARKVCSFSPSRLRTVCRQRGNRLSWSFRCQVILTAMAQCDSRSPAHDSISLCSRVQTGWISHISYDFTSFHVAVLMVAGPSSKLRRAMERPLTGAGHGQSPQSAPRRVPRPPGWCRGRTLKSAELHHDGGNGQNTRFSLCDRDRCEAR